MSDITLEYLEDLRRRVYDCLQADPESAVGREGMSPAEMLRLISYIRAVQPLLAKIAEGKTCDDDYGPYCPFCGEIGGPRPEDHQHSNPLYPEFVDCVVLDAQKLVLS